MISDCSQVQVGRHSTGACCIHHSDAFSLLPHALTMWKQSKSGQSGKPTHLQAPRNRVLQTKEKAFDVESGQIYTETQVRVASKQHSDWIGEFRTPSLLKPSRPNAQGARTLLDMAKTCTVKELRSLSSEHFMMLPWSAAKGIWEEVVAR